MKTFLDTEAQTTLDGGINSSVTSLDIVTVGGSPASAPFRIWIDDEIFVVTNVAGDTYTVVRAVEGSDAASHSNGADIFYPKTAGNAVELAVDIARSGGGGGTGDVVGPASAVADDIATLNGTTGKLIKDGGKKIADLVLANGAITGATKTKITYDSKGLVTAGADAVLADLAATTADFSMNSHKLTSVTDPASAQDAATKAYVDAQVVSAASLSRGTAAFTTASLADQATESSSFSLGKSSLVYKLVADQFCRVRFYSTSAARDSDVSRVPTTAPDVGLGLLLDVVMNTSPLLTFKMQPPAISQNMDTSVVATIYYNVTNLSGSSHTITVTATRLLMES